MEHRLRYMVDEDSEYISNEELDSLEEMVDFDEFFEEYEFSGSFILTTNIADRDEAVCGMCCGIVTRDFKVGEKDIYLAFDWGH